MGWYSDENFANQITQIPNGSTGDTMIYASWELDTFNIQYELFGGINNPLNPQQYTIESNEIIFENADKEDFVFKGWFWDENYSDSVTSLSTGNIGDIIIYAKWIQLFDVNFNITTDGVNPANNVEIVIGNSQNLLSDDLGKADTTVVDGSSMNYSVEINGVLIDDGSVTVEGSDVTVNVQIVDCYMRWYDVIFCDNGDGLWTEFKWYKDNELISEEQFFHNPGGIEDGTYTCKVTSINGVEYTWEGVYQNNNFIGNEYKANRKQGSSTESNSFELKVYPNPVNRGNTLKITLSESFDLQSSKIYIYSINGSLVFTIEDPFYIEELNMENNFSSGKYYLVLIDSKNNIKKIEQFIVR
jgi:uncharacterized repeat protein (TIGR02543 family)